MIVENFPILILDIYPKVLFDAYPKELEDHPKELLKSDELKLHFKQKLNNEFVLNNGKKFVSDLPHMTFEDIVINLEFQSYKINEDRETIFNVYQAELHNEHKKHVITVVFSMGNDEHELITHKINLYDGLTILIISLNALNQKQTLNNSNYKLRNNIIISDKEKALFLLSSMMDENNKVEVLKENIRLTINAKNLSSQEIRDMLDIQINFAAEWFDNADFIELGDLLMRNLTPKAEKRLKDVFEKIIEERAREEEKKLIVSNILSNNLSYEETSKLTGLSVKEISDIAQSN